MKRIIKASTGSNYLNEFRTICKSLTSDIDQRNVRFIAANWDTLPEHMKSDIMTLVYNIVDAQEYGNGIEIDDALLELDISLSEVARMLRRQ